jgi:hypothetical protein
MRPGPEQALEVTIPEDGDADVLRTEANAAIPFAENREDDFDLRLGSDARTLRRGQLRSVRDGGLDDESGAAQLETVDAHAVFGVGGLIAHGVTSRTAVVGPLV